MNRKDTAYIDRENLSRNKNEMRKSNPPTERHQKRFSSLTISLRHVRRTPSRQTKDCSVTLYKFTFIQRI